MEQYVINLSFVLPFLPHVINFFQKFFQTRIFKNFDLETKIYVLIVLIYYFKAFDTNDHNTLLPVSKLFITCVYN